jgi:hypothetical protein
MNRYSANEIFHILLFLVFILVFYSAMHFYMIARVRRAFPGPRSRLLIPLSAFMILAPVFILTFKKIVPVPLTQALCVVAYLWLAWMFWFCSFSAGVDLWNLAVRRPWGGRARLGPAFIRPRVAVSAILILIAVCTAWGYHEAATVRVKTLTIQTPKLPAGTKPIRIVLISDLHLTPMLGADRLKRTLDLAARQRPDLLLCAGDLVDAPLASLQEEARLLAALNAPLGKFAVTGNHDYYLGKETSLEFHSAAGFPVLQNESVLLNQRLRLVGVDDRSGFRSPTLWHEAEDRSLPPTKDSEFVLLLKHRPLLNDLTKGRFDLQLSGHVHGGQTFPFGLFMWLSGSRRTGLHHLEDGALLYVTRGAGTWGPPLRVLAPPEINVIVLEPATLSANP